MEDFDWTEYLRTVEELTHIGADDEKAMFSNCRIVPILRVPQVRTKDQKPETREQKLSIQKHRARTVAQHVLRRAAEDHLNDATVAIGTDEQ